MTNTQPTSRKAYRETIEAGEDVSLRRKIAAELASGGRTTHELAQAFPEHSANAIRPRVDELIRMDCVVRDGTRTNPSGHDAYVNVLTDRGLAYARGECDPDPKPPLADLRRQVVDVARKVTRGECGREVLDLAVEKHDRAKRRRDPEWSP